LPTAWPQRTGGWRVIGWRSRAATSNPSTAHAAADDGLIRREDGELALAALEAIPLDRRAVFVLHEIDGVSIPEVATAMDIPANTAYSRLRLAREAFQAAVKRLRLRRGDE
jgi:RNA polymerase sigma-70 factor (ECF subfamily)